MRKGPTHTGAALKARREHLGRTVAECAKALKLSTAQVEDLEAYNAGLLKTAQAYAQHLGLRLTPKVGPRSTRDVARIAVEAGVCPATARSVLMLAHRIEDSNPRLEHAEQVLLRAGGALELR